MKTTFIHTADWQIGKPFAGVEDPEKRSILSQQRIEAIKRIGLAAQENKAQFVLVAGDLFDSTSPTKAIVSKTLNAIGTIGVPVYIIPGNHDHGGAGSIWHQEFFLEEQKEQAPNLQVILEAKPVEIAQAIILPCPLLRKHENRDLTTWLREAAVYEGLDPTKPRIVLAHGGVDSFGSLVDEEEFGTIAANFLDIDRLPLEQLDYVALGDWHGYKGINSKTWYSGTPEPDRFPKGENHHQGYALSVNVERNKVPEIKTIATGKVVWSRLEHQFSGEFGLGGFSQKIMDLVGNRVDEDLLHLSLRGNLGLEDFKQLEFLLERLKARLVRLKLNRTIKLEPTEEELEILVNSMENPLIQRVAVKLKGQMEREEESAPIAQLALKELYFNVEPK